MTSIKANELPIVAKYVYDISGISLDSSKAYLLEARLSPLLKQYDCADFVALLTIAKNDRKGEINNQIIDAISTNETLFFRDKSPFELLKNKLLPDIIKTKGNSSPPRIRIWSAASSTGQELYSIAITARELLGPQRSKNISLLGTDISPKAVARASYGEYNKFEIERGLDNKNLRGFFEQKERDWKIKDEIRSMVQFKKFNLMDSFSGLGTFDIIFCRNVAIYFSLADRKLLFSKMEKALNENGILILGSTESLTGISTGFDVQRQLNCTYYQKKKK